MAFPPTEPGLPARLADPGDAAAWDRFVAIYRPALLALARRRGLSAADADDVAQEVCRSVAAAVGRFEPREGGGRARFSTWLATIAERKSIDALRRKRAGTAAGPVLDSLAARTTDSRLLRLEIRRRLFHAAADDIQGQVSPSAWEAFWRTAVDGDTPDRVATSLGMTTGAVYAAKARVMRKLVERLGGLEAEWTTDGLAPETENRGER